MRKITDEKIIAGNGTDEAVRGRRVRARRQGAEMVNLVQGELEKHRPEFLNLQIDILDRLPRWRLVTELIDWRSAIAADRRSKISEPGQAARAIGQRGVSFKTEV